MSWLCIKLLTLQLWLPCCCCCWWWWFWVPALGATGYAILTLRRWEGEAPYVRRFLLWFAAMVAELLFENCMVW
jgi:hypothetical protein